MIKIKSKNVRGLIYSFLNRQEAVEKISCLSKTERALLVDKRYFEGVGVFRVDKDFLWDHEDSNK